MATVHDRYCLDDFTIEIMAGCDADITIPGDFPIVTTPNSNYFIGFTYITGDPPATGWHVQWTIRGDDTTEYPGDERPSVMITPEVPVEDDDLCGLKNGTIRGTVPEPEGNRLYRCTLSILQI